MTRRTVKANKKTKNVQENVAYWWQGKAIRVLRILTLMTGLLQLFFGELIIGIYTLFSLGIISLPGKFTRNAVTVIPREFEFIFFVMVLLQFIIGETLDFYYFVPYYDKFVHFSLPFFVGLIGFLLAYTMYATGNLKITARPMIFLIVFMTLGIGALWEIIEYLWDVFFYEKFPSLGKMQGSLIEGPLEDTMHDLMMDMAGGIFGSLLGLRYIRAEQKKRNSRLAGLVAEIVSNFRRKKKSVA